MATTKQRQAVEKMAENGGNASRAMRDVGYSPATAKTPEKLTDSKGFAEVCAELGLTDSLVVGALVEDIKANKGKRVPELALAAKIMGLEKAPQTGPNPIRVLLLAYGLLEGGNESEVDGLIQGSSSSET